MRSKEEHSWSLVMGDAVGFPCELGQMLSLCKSFSLEFAGYLAAVVELTLSDIVTGVLH